MMKQVRHLFWDFDGTLFDSYPELSGSFMKGLKELGFGELLDHAQLMRLMKGSVGHAAEWCANQTGLSKEEIELLGREGHNVTKVSRRDLPFVVAAGKNGATTVASTMIIAALAGIKVFATGGIGGVHRGAEHTFDISADLQELANTNVTVVCAGAKSILDLGLTTEYLETFGVPLIGYQTKALPAFFCRTSPFEVSIRLDSAREIARAMAVKWQTGLNGGLVVANPIPEQFAMPEETINAAIDQAVAEAEEQGVIGKESTPFLLARVAELTGGDSLKSNIQLVFNNAILASEIAKEYQRLVG